MLKHVLGCIAAGIIIIGPLPLCLAMILKIENITGRFKASEPGNTNTGDHKGAGDELEHGSLAQRLLVGIVCWLFLQTAAALCLGYAHLFTLPAILLTETIILFTGAAVLQSIRKKKPGFEMLSLLDVHGRLSIYEKLVLGIMVLVGFMLVWTVLARPITDFDSNAYHLPVMAKWFQAGHSARLPGSHIISFYPYNWEALCALFLLPFRGSDLMAAVPNIAAWLVFGLSIYGLSRELRVKRLYRLTVSSLALMIPIVILNVNTMHVDLAMAAFFMAGLYFIALYSRTRSVPFAVLFTGSLALMLGVKTSALIYGLILAGIFLYKHFRKNKEQKSSTGKSAASPGSNPGRTLFRTRLNVPVILVLAGFLLVGGSWYIQNLIQIGNPIGNVDVKFAGVTLFHGNTSPAMLAKTTLLSTFDTTNPGHWRILLEDGGDKLRSPVLLIGLLLVIYLTLLFRRKRHYSKTFLLLFAGLIGSVFVFYILTPYSGSHPDRNFMLTPWFVQAIRYGFPFLGVIAVAAAAVTRTFFISPLAVFILFLTAVVHAFFLNIQALGIPGDAVLFAIITLPLAWLICTHYRMLISKYRIPLVALLIMGLISMSYVTGRLRAHRYYNSYKALPGFMNRTIPPDAPIGFMKTHNRYLFFGKYLSREVYRVDAVRDQPLREWLAELRAKNIRYIVMGRVKKHRLSKKASWLMDPGGKFTRIFGDDHTKGFTIYRLKEK